MLWLKLQLVFEFTLTLQPQPSTENGTLTPPVTLFADMI